jgi:hypothetical protein
MASGLFDLAAERLEQHTSLDRLQTRGTLRLALKTAGLDPKGVTTEQLRVLFERVLPDELETRGVGDAASICRAVIDDLASSPEAQQASAGASPDEIFQRLGGD